MKITEIRSDFFNTTYLSNEFLTNEKLIKQCEIIATSKLLYLSFLSSLFNIGEITEKQFHNEANKIIIYVCDIMNKDGTFKNNLTDHSIKNLSKYFNNLHNYNLYDPVPHEAF